MSETPSIARAEIASEAKVVAKNELFSATFTWLRIIGYWSPTTVKRPLKVFYEIYKLISLLGIILFFVVVMLDSVLGREKSWLDFFENMFLLQSLVNCFCKVSNILLRRHKVEKLVEKLVDDRWSDLRDNVEIGLAKASQESERRFTRYYSTMVIINYLSVSLKPILFDNPNKDLIVPAYTPCDRHNPGCFWMCYLHLNFAYFISSLAHVAGDSLIFNFIERICTHQQILQHRFLQLPAIVTSHRCQLKSETQLFRECAQDHQSLLETIADLNNAFFEVVLVQFFSSTTLLCTNIYFLANQQLFGPEFNATLTHLICIMVQSFCFCWYGYKVSFNSSSFSRAICNMDWYILQVNTRKMLMFVIMKSSDQVQLFTNALVSLTPETFLEILKLSYSAFNILQQTNQA